MNDFYWELNWKSQAEFTTPRNLVAHDLIQHITEHGLRHARGPIQPLPLHMYSIYHDMLIFVIPSRYYTSLFFGFMVKFGPSVRPSGKKYSAVPFLFIRPSGYGLMDPPLQFSDINCISNIFFQSRSRPGQQR